LEKTTVENVQNEAEGSNSDPTHDIAPQNVATDEKKGYRESLGQYAMALALVGSLVFIVLNHKTPEPAPAPKTENELAVERINERNTKIAPLSDACVTLEELKRANESDLSILFQKH